MCWFVCFIAGASGSAQRTMKDGKVSPTHFHTSQTGWLCGNLVVPSGGLPGPAPAAGVQCVQVQLLQVRAGKPKGRWSWGGSWGLGFGPRLPEPPPLQYSSSWELPPNLLLTIPSPG